MLIHSFFANTGTSLDHAVGWQCIKAVICCFGTSSKRASVKPSTDTWGHSEAINKHVYKCPLAIGEIVNVGGFLKAVHDPPLVSCQCQEKQVPQSSPLELSMSSPHQQKIMDTIILRQKTIFKIQPFKNLKGFQI